MAKKKQPKTFILDTNVILHDPTCIDQFQENDVVIPLIVIEEMDRFKRGSQVINLNAREFARKLDTITGDAIFNGGVSLGEGKGKVRVVIIRGLHDDIKHMFKEDSADHRVLSTAYEEFQKTEHKDRVILVTKDVNLRMKAKAVGMRAEDYTTDRISVDELYSGMEVLEDFDDDVIQKLYQPPHEVPAEEIFDKVEIEKVPNKFYIMRNHSRSALANLDHESQHFRKVDKQLVFGIRPRNAEQAFAVDALINNDIPLVTLTGKAGTGKTLLALASALNCRKFYRQIYVARPVVPLSNKDIGFLPGDVESKLAPYMQPLWDNLKVIQDQFLNRIKVMKLLIIC